MKKSSKLIFSSLSLIVTAVPLLVVSSSCSAIGNNTPTGDNIGSYHTMSRAQYEKYYYTYQDDISFRNADGVNYDKGGINLAAPIYPINTHFYKNNMNQADNDNKWADLQGFAILLNDDKNADMNKTYGNSYLDFFINPQVAAYFTGGKHNVKEIVTVEKLKDFVDSKMSSKLDLKGLYADDYERDNSVMALLNPMLWNILLDRNTSFSADYVGNSAYTAFEGCEFESEIGQKCVNYIDLSHNHLRNVPNWASLKGPKRGLHFMLADEPVTESNYTPAEYYFEGQRDVVVVNPEASGTIFNGINLENNSLTYLNLNPAPAQEDGNTPDKYTPTYVPGLASMVKPFKDATFERTEFDGLMLDYNYMPYIYLLPQYATCSTVPNPIWGVIKVSGLDLLDGSYYFINYTRVNSDNLIIYFIELVMQLGCYQTDKTTITDRDISNYLKVNLPAGMTNKEINKDISLGSCLPITTIYFYENYGFSGQQNQSWTTILNSANHAQGTFSSYKGQFIFSIMVELSIGKYLPKELSLSGDIPSIVREALSLFDMRVETPIYANVFKHIDIAVILNIVTLSTIAGSIAAIYIFRFYIRKRNMKIRQNSFIRSEHDALDNEGKE